MSIATLFASLYRFFAPRRRWLVGGLLLLLASGAVASRGMRLEEDIAAMLPDDASAVARDFRLLQQAPFSRKLVISLDGGAGVDAAALIQAVDKFAAALPAELFSRVVSGPDSAAGPQLLPQMARLLPSLADARDRAALLDLDEYAVRERLADSYTRLLSPEGWGMKELVRSDPLGLAPLALGKLQAVNLIPGARVVDGHFLSADGRHALLLADTPVAITDSAGAQKLLDAFDRARAGLPPGVRATLVSGHRYTLANASVIKQDLALVLSLSSLAILAIYIGFLRSRWAFFVFLLPASVLILASGAVTLLYPAVFAMTIGFGGVLLGIADEYAMHVYFAFRRGTDDPARTVGEVARPVLYGCLATLCSFAVMLFSALPGQRQLAVYAMIGIVLALLLSLVALPHLVRPATAPEALGAVPGLNPAGRTPRRWVLGLWLALLVLCLWQAGNVRFNGELRGLNYVPESLRADEEALQRIWGNMRGRALLFVEGSDLDSALAANEQLYRYLRERLPREEIVSLAPLLPSPAAAAANRAAWTTFWRGAQGDRILSDLAREGAAYGFSARAFAPFVAATRVPGPLSVEGWRSAGLGDLIDSLLLKSERGYRVITLVPDTPMMLGLFGSADPAATGGALLVSQARFGEAVSSAIGNDFARYLGLTLLVVVVLVTVLLRRPRHILLALVPVVTGLLVMFGVMGWAGIEFNLFNIVATVLIIGLCVDYGIFMVCKLSDAADHAGDRAVLVSGMTTIAGFGILVLARHPAMHSIGVTVLLGIGAAIPTALLVIPALYRLTEKKR